jgi:hypothetical protein
MVIRGKARPCLFWILDERRMVNFTVVLGNVGARITQDHEGIHIKVQ